jgi:tetratricopeptide (TPR) repeat protein
LADVLLALAVAGSMLAIGAVYPLALVGVALLVVGALAIAMLGPLSAGPARVSLPALIVLGLAAYTLLQALPLPIAILSKIAPLNADVWQRALLPFDLAGPSWASISLDRGGSCVEALKWFVYAGIFVLSAWMSERRGAEWGVGLVFGCAVLLSLVTVGHGLANATAVFGIYKPHMIAGPWHVSPLLNTNNLAGYLNLGAMCGLGLLIARRPPVPRWIVGLGVATIVGVEVISASRAGFLVFPLGVAMFAFLQRLPNQEQDENVSRRAFPWLLGAAVGGGAILAILGGTAATWQELYDKNLEKLAMISWTKPLIRDHPWFGIGRGAFESVFPLYRAYIGNMVFTHAENFPAQWISEWGIPVALAAMGALGWIFRPGSMGVRRSSICAGAWIGVFILLAQNMLDLALEVPAVSIAMAGTLGSIWGDYKRRRTTRVSGWSMRWHDSTQAAAAGMVVTGLLVGVAVFATTKTGVREVGRDKDELYERLLHLETKDRLAVAAFRKDLKEAMLRHPAEPYLPLLGAITARSVRDMNPMPWIQRTLERSAVNGPAHILLADILAGHQATSQALMELRLAVNDDPGFATIAAAKASALTHDFDELMRSVPAGTVGVVALESLASRMSAPGETSLRERLEREALARDPNRPEPHRALANELIQRIASQDAVSCHGDTLPACEEELKEHVSAVERAFPNRSDADVIRANLLVAKGRAADGEHLLAARCDAVEDHASCLQARLATAVQVPASRVLAVAAKDALAGGCTSSTDCAGLATWIGDLMTRRGDWGGASAYYSKAAREEPNEDRWLKLALAASQLGSHAQAADALQRVKQMRGGIDPELDARIQEHRRKALGLVEK